MNLHTPILAPALRRGGRVAVISPSSPVTPSMLDGTVRYWTERGYYVQVGEHVGESLGGYLAGSAEARAADLNAALHDDSVDLIIAAMGGKGAAQMLPLIDYDAMRQRPRLFMGLSDSSVLSLALHARTGVVTFHGPTGVNFGELGVPPYTERSMFHALTSSDPLSSLPKFSDWRTVRDAAPRTGALIGGHLGTIRALIGTPFEPSWDDAIVFIEEVAVEYHDIDAALTHFRLAGVLGRIGGLVVGRPVEVAERTFQSGESLDEVVLRVCGGYDFPIVSNVDIGHTDEKVTVPIGIRTTLLPASAELIIEEAATSDAR